MFVIDSLLRPLEIKLGTSGFRVKPILCCSFSNIKMSNQTSSGCILLERMFEGTFCFYG